MRGELRVRKNGRGGRGEGRVCRKEVSMCFYYWCFGTLGNTILLFSLSFFRTDVDVGVDGGNDGVGRFMMDFK